jgi:flavin reductase (DIM6/NTAB) family NADH-FMN oxidoreductase RutF
MESDDELIDAFETGRIEGADFPHERHVRVAWELARRYPQDDAFARLVVGIRGIASRAGNPGAYHATITRAWFELIAAADSLDRHPELLDKTLLRRYYSADRLAAGRDRWLEPDLQPLRLLELTDVLRGIPTAVAVLATRSQETVHATTVSSVASVSKDPALVSVCLDSRFRSLARVREAGSFTLSILASDQHHLAEHFARSGRSDGPAQFAGIAHHLDSRGPFLENAAAWIGCDLHAVHECGDHHIVIGRVGLANASDRRPLIRQDGAYRS